LSAKGKAEVVSQTTSAEIGELQHREQEAREAFWLSIGSLLRPLYQLFSAISIASIVGGGVSLRRLSSIKGVYDRIRVVHSSGTKLAAIQAEMRDFGANQGNLWGRNE